MPQFTLILPCVCKKPSCLPSIPPFPSPFLFSFTFSPSDTAVHHSAGLWTPASFPTLSFIRTLKSRNHSLLSSAGRCHLLRYPSHLADDQYEPFPSASPLTPCSFLSPHLPLPPPPPPLLCTVFLTCQHVFSAQFHGRKWNLSALYKPWHIGTRPEWHVQWWKVTKYIYLRAVQYLLYLLVLQYFHLNYFYTCIPLHFREKLGSKTLFHRFAISYFDTK